MTDWDIVVHITFMPYMNIHYVWRIYFTCTLRHIGLISEIDISCECIHQRFVAKGHLESFASSVSDVDTIVSSFQHLISFFVGMGAEGVIF